ncbi:uncharacterized protein LOC113962257 isoform X1 [Neopelma chrysocephalum]|uniref:uncharacterized protein LOC113962257 isoform X1 n=1 Tax=Neopelma chrysocephalum TaxID=114329 RepID=UPI000FCD2FB7|nr:uncharacterized protein LOC113962257 isoform X1 [Neopelma chrysocephalum]
MPEQTAQQRNRHIGAGNVQRCWQLYIRHRADQQPGRAGASSQLARRCWPPSPSSWGCPWPSPPSPPPAPRSSRSPSTTPPSPGNETCVMKNSSKLQVLHENSTLVHVDENQVVSMARVIQSHEDLLILNHINIDSPSLSLSARTHNVSKEHMEEFKAHLHCLGLTEEDVVYTSMKDACPPPAEKTGEGDADPQVE